MVGVQGNGHFVDEMPYRWSRRWSAGRLLGPRCSLGEGLVEIHVGRGIWQTVGATERTGYAPGGGPTIVMPCFAAVPERACTSGSFLSGNCVRSLTLSPTCL